MPHVMYIFVNMDLNMSPGKISSQVGHCVHIIVDEILSNYYELNNMIGVYSDYLEWNKNCTKIVLKAKETDMIKLQCRSDIRSFYDKGNTTQGTDNKLTVVGTLPILKTDDFNDFSLL